MLVLDKTRQQLLADLWDALVRELLSRVKSGEATAGDLSVARHIIRDVGLRVVSESRAEFERVLDQLPTFDLTDEVQ